MIRLMLIDLNLDELHYHPAIISMKRCDGSCNTIEYLVDGVCVPSKTEVVNLESVNRIKGIGESQTLAKHNETTISDTEKK